jgi:hypothetical protein
MNPRLLIHVLEGDCVDPDCEVHRPEVIEDEQSRANALAWFLAGQRADLTALTYTLEAARELVPPEQMP